MLVSIMYFIFVTVKYYVSNT